MNQSPQAQAQEVMFSVLSLDGGGIKGLSSLLILRAVMRKAVGNDTDPIYPWKYFTIICGTSTGGLIALMLGQLRMSIDDALVAYEKLGEEIFSPKKWFWKEGRYKATNLERAVKRIVGEAQNRDETHQEVRMEEVLEEEAQRGFMRKILGGDRKQRQAQKMRDEENEKKGEGVMMLDDREDACKTFVCSMLSDALFLPTHLRSYHVMANQGPICKIWEAARATSAAPYFFKPMVIEEYRIKMTYVDGGLRCNNPTKRLISEMYELGLSNQPACILSIGTGRSKTACIPRVGGIPKLQLLGVSTAMRHSATDCEMVHQEIEKDFSRRPTEDVYVRLNVDQGMHDIGLQEWKRYADIKRYTYAYLEDPLLQRQLIGLKSHLRVRPGCE